MRKQADILVGTLKVACNAINENISEQISLFDEVVTQTKREAVKQASNVRTSTVNDVASAYSTYETSCGIADAALQEVAVEVRSKLAALIDKFEADIKKSNLR